MKSFDIHSDNTSGVVPSTTLSIEDTIKEVIDPLADKLMEHHFSYTPPNLLISKDAWKENKKKEIVDVLSGAELRKNIAKGLEIIFEYVNRQLPRVEANQIYKEWEEGSAAYLAYLATQKPLKVTLAELETKESDDLNTNEQDMEEIMKISPSTIEHFYGAGIYKFQDRQYKDASCVFTVLTILNHRRHNVWISLGISLEYNQEIELALQAFDMSIMTNPDDPLSYIHAAQCCIQNRQLDKAKSLLNLAEDAAIKSPESNEFMQHINELKNDCR